MTLLQSFERELYRSRVTLKSLETDTLYLVFKDRIPNCLNYSTDSLDLP